MIETSSDLLIFMIGGLSVIMIGGLSHDMLLLFFMIGGWFEHGLGSAEQDDGC